MKIILAAVENELADAWNAFAGILNASASIAVRFWILLAMLLSVLQIALALWIAALI
jgi:hypothetical protein